MTEEKRYQQAKVKAERRSKELFKTTTEEVENELAKETILGSPENLIRPDNEED
jgi:hypothetical protein